MINPRPLFVKSVCECLCLAVNKKKKLLNLNSHGHGPPIFTLHFSLQVGLLKDCRKTKRVMAHAGTAGGMSEIITFGEKDPEIKQMILYST